MNMWDKLKTGNHRISSEDKNILSNLKFIKKSLRCFLRVKIGDTHIEIMLNNIFFLRNSFRLRIFSDEIFTTKKLSGEEVDR